MNKIASSATSRATAILAIITVAIILAFAALLTLPLQAQSAGVKLVGNTGSTTLTSQSYNGIVAQRFLTGTDTDGYLIAEVGVRFHNVSGKSASVAIKDNNNLNRPGNLVATLDNPSTLTSNAVNWFTVPDDTRLDSNTRYWIVANDQVNNTGNRAQVSYTSNTGQSGEAGWEIDNNRVYRNAGATWLTSQTSALIEIRGTPVQSSDATLSGLALTYGGGNEMTLTPPFVTGTKSYTALVANSVSSITLTPTVNDANATVEYLDASDASITDTDTSTPALDAPLAVLDNTFKVKVTAEAGSTNTDTYTVVVTREAQAQSLTTFVTNTGGSGITDSDRFQAQSFETGANEGGYTVSQVDIFLGDVSGKSTSVSIKEDNGGEPGNLVTTLTNPGTLTSNQFNTFTAPDIITLDANTTYWLTVNEGISSDRVFVSSKPADDELSLSGWGIGDGSLHRTSEMVSWSNSEPFPC